MVHSCEVFGSLLLAFFQCFGPTVVAELSSGAFNKQLYLQDPLISLLMSY